MSPYWFIIAGVFIVIYANDLSASLSGNMRYVVAAAFVVLLYVSVLVHELAHSVVARGFGLPVRRILLYPLGGVSEIEREAQTPGREFAVAAAGPALSLVLGAVGWGLAQVAPYGVTGALIRQLMFANFVVAAFNLLPGLPLDGGRMLRAVIWKVTGRPNAATIAAAWVGRVLAIGAARDPVLLRRAGRRRHGEHAVGGGDRRVHVDRRQPVDQGHQVPRAAARAAGAPPGAPGRLGPGEHPARRGGQAGRRGRRPRDRRRRPRQRSRSGSSTRPPSWPRRRSAGRGWTPGSMARTIEPNMVLSADLQGMALLDAIRRAPATEYLLVEPVRPGGRRPRRPRPRPGIRRRIGPRPLSTLSAVKATNQRGRSRPGTRCSSPTPRAGCTR